MKKKPEILSEMAHYHTLLAKEHYQLIKYDYHPTIMEHIDLIREQELKLIDCITPHDAFLLFSTLIKSDDMLNHNSEASIINNTSTFSCYDRLLRQLIYKMTEKESLWEHDLAAFNNNSFSYLAKNFFAPLYLDDPENLVLHKAFSLDHVYRFLGLLEDRKDDLSTYNYRRTKFGFLYLYPELLDEISQKNRIINRKNSQILATQYNFIAQLRNIENLEQSKKQLSEDPVFYAMKNFTILTDKTWTTRNHQDQLIINEVYLRSFLEPLKVSTIKHLYQSFLNRSYREGNVLLDGSNCLAYITLLKSISTIIDEKTYYRK